MNATKAREFFSAYYEGELSGGILEAFERELASNAELKVEYDEFCGVMALLTEPAQEITIPADLNEVIMARLDQQAWQEKQAAPQGFFGKFKFAMIGGLAACAIFAGIMSVSRPVNSNVSQGGVLPVVNPVKIATEVDLTFGEAGPELTYVGQSGSTLTVIKLADGTELGSLDLGGVETRRALENESDSADVFSVNGKDGESLLTVVLPGKVQGDLLKGEGTIIDLAKALADTFRTPLILRVENLDKEVSWEFEMDGDTASRAAKLEKDGLSLSVRTDGISILSGS